MTKKVKEIKKPWAVFGIPCDFGKIVEDSKNSCYIQYCEGQMYPPACWDSKWVKKFDNPLEAINYFLNHNLDQDYYDSREKVIGKFLFDFPSERKTLKKLLVQSELKCTEQPPQNNLESMGWFDHWFEDI